MSSGIFRIQLERENIESLKNESEYLYFLDYQVY